ncbi:MAG TPA: type II toxin-antitoxin system PemK/MazF family toxin [Thermoplasmata archaeon]|nr:type II toxin-antitoxin system PemK/MazF family toxin [Thermoplasmata archaeon]
MRKGAVCWADLEEGVGHEQKGRRPVVVIGEANGILTVVPLTTTMKRANLSHTEIIEPSRENGLREPSVALIFQLKSLDSTRITQAIGALAREDVVRIDALLCDLLGLD